VRRELGGVADLLGKQDEPQAEQRRPQRLAASVIADFVDQIVGGTFPPGTSLPSEAAMCKHLGVSRTVLREVLTALEEKGLVEVRNGIGTRTTDPESWKLLDPIVLRARIAHDENDDFVSHLVRMRMVLEGDMASEAATCATEEDLEKLKAQLIELDTAISGGDVESHFRNDFVFHDIVMRASGNELAHAVVMAINDEARAHLHYDRADVAQFRRAFGGHTAVYEALAARDPDRAASAMRDHIEASWRLRIAEQD
jgi:DNA-binding FadR family transcriptional regulator